MKKPSFLAVMAVALLLPGSVAAWDLFLDGSTLPGSEWLLFTDIQPDNTAVISFLDPIGGTNNDALRISTETGADEWYIGPFFANENAAGARFRLVEFSPTGKENLLCITTASTLNSPAPSITLVDGRYKLWNYVNADTEIMDLGSVVSNEWHTAYLWARNDGKVKLWWDDKLVFDGDAPPVNPFAGYIEWGCGSWEYDASETADFDWVGWGNPTNLPIGLVTVPANGASYADASAGFDFTLTSFNGVATNGFRLTVNGMDRTADLQVGGNSTNRVGHLGGLFTNVFYQIQLIATDLATNTSKYTIAFDTVSQSNFHFESEDWNFDSGNFLNAVILASAAGPDNYLERIGTAGIDENDPDPDPSVFEHQYRSGSAVATEMANDILRQNYLDAQITDPGIADFNVRFVAKGEWLNYTRTFPTGQFFLYGRLASGEMDQFEVAVAKVTGATTPNQTLTPLGSFKGDTGHGWQNYSFIPLTDAQTNPIVVPLGGVETLRLTSTLSTNNVNFVMLVPAPVLVMNFIDGKAVISWQTNLDSFSLQSASSLSAGSWTNVLTPVGLVNGRYTLTNELTDRSLFFRLKQK